MGRKEFGQSFGLVICIIFSIALSACDSAVTPIIDTPLAASPQPSEITGLPTENDTATETATAVPTETEKTTQQTIEALAIEAKKSGVLPSLDGEQRKAFIDELNKIEDPTGRREQDHWVYVEINKETNQLSILINEELVPIAESENISPAQWQGIINKDNIDEVIVSGEFSSPDYNFDPVRKADRLIRDYESNIAIVVILLPIPEDGLINPAPTNPGLNARAIPELTIRFIKDEKGELVPIGETVYQFSDGGWGFLFLREGSKNKNGIFGSDSDFLKNGGYKVFQNIKPFEVYYAITSSDPVGLLTLRREEYGGKAERESIGEPNFTPIADSYEAVNNPDLTRTGAPVLINPGGDCILIRTDGKW